MTTEENSAQDAEAKEDDKTEEPDISKDALSNLAAALEAKDDKTEEDDTNEETKKEDAEEENTTKDEETGTEKEGNLSKNDEVSDLRSLLRDQKRQISLLEAKQNRVDKRTSKVIDEETGEETDIDEELSPIETKITARNELSTQRGAGLEIMLEQMSDTKKWGDVKEVVTERRVTEIIDAVADDITTKQGGDLEENRLDVELSVWSIANPYKYMYDLIKQYHPDYGAVEKKETKTKTTKTKEKAPVNSPGSIGNIKGGNDKGGWTNSKIDGMDEMDLGKVPKDVYEKYLRGELE